jgi:hypothetical protein
MGRDAGNDVAAIAGKKMPAAAPGTASPLIPAKAGIHHHGRRRCWVTAFAGPRAS